MQRSARFTCFALMASLAGCGGAPVATPAALDAPAASIPVVLQPSPSPIVEIRLGFQAGSAFDPPDRPGMAALMARLITEGGTEALSNAALLDTLQPWAASINAQVDKERLVFFARCHRDHLEQFYPVLRDVLLAPRMGADDFTRLQQQSIDTITKEIRVANDEELSKLVLEAALYAGHPYAHPVIGTVAGLEKITLADVKAHRARILTRDRLVIGLAGGADQTLADRLLEDLAGLPATGDLPMVIPDAPADRKQLVVVEQPGAQSAAISIGHHLELTRRHPDFPILTLVASWFGEHRQAHGQLYQSIRELRGMNYGSYAYVEAFRQEGWGRQPLTNLGRGHQYFSIWLRPVRHDDRFFAVQIARWNLAKLLKDGLSAADFEKARAFLGGYVYLRQESDMRALGYAMDDRFYGLPRRYTDWMRAGWTAATADAVNAKIRQHLSDRALTTVVVVKDAAEFVAKFKAMDLPRKTYTSPKPAEIEAEDAIIAQIGLDYAPEQITIVESKDLFAK